MKNVNEYKVEIITGQYITAPLEQKLMIKNLLGEDVEYHFEIYFHWYNMIHELGHAVLEYNCPNRPHPADEEQWVNNFAIAYWRHYGEIEKLETLRSIVHEALSKFIVPTDNNKNHLDYAKEQWGKEELYSFNNYGWFQFRCVEQSISQQLSLEQVLRDMGLTNIQWQKEMLLEYKVDERMPYQVIEDAQHLLYSWGISLPKEISVVLSDDPNCHMCQSKRMDAIKR